MSSVPANVNPNEGEEGDAPEYEEVPVQSSVFIPTEARLPAFTPLPISFMNNHPNIPPRPEFDSADQFALITAYFDERFSSMEERLTTSSSKEEKEEKTFKYKKRSNQIQGEFNQGILDSVVKAKRLLTAGGSQSTKKTQEILNDVEKTVNHRNKLVKMADTSRGGWDTVG